MRMNIGIAIVVLWCVWPPRVLAQASQPCGTDEQFVTTTRLPGKDVVRELLRFDAAAGTQVVLVRSSSWGFPSISFLDARGRHLGLCRQGQPSSTAPVELKSPQAGDPVRVFREPEVHDMRPAALSPDGKKIVFYNPSKQLLVIGNNTTVHKIHTNWAITRPFSWSPDSRQVAFYYASSWDADDFNIQEHGVALLTLDGRIRVLAEASSATGTPRSPAAKYVPLGWGQSGQAVYYTAGLTPDDPQRQSPATKALVPPTATNRIDISSGQSERIGLGDFACVSPDEEYVLIYPSPKPVGHDKWARCTTKVLIRTREATYLPDEILLPRISPSGRLVASFGYGPTIRFFTTADWKPCGNSVPVSRRSIEIEDWAANFRWITVDKSPEAK